MLKVVTAEQMQAIDRTTIDHRGISGETLMDRAGRAIADEIFERFQPMAVGVVAGKGNNGGDGFVAARYLHERGVPVTVHALAEKSDLRGEALNAFELLPDAVPLVPVGEDFDALERALAQCDVVLDAILGTGITGPVTGRYAEAIAVINASGANVVAADVPSGMIADGSPIEGPCVQAHVTITIGLPKIGLVTDPNRRFAGIVSIADIGFPDDLTTSDDLPFNLLDVEGVRAMLPSRSAAGHKGTFGSLLVLAGSEGMTGAAVLCARAATRSGVGLVYCAYPRSLGSIMESHLIEPVKIPLAGDEGWFAESHTDDVVTAAGDRKAFAIGPGIGRRETTGNFLRAVLEKIELPCVIDADGLNLIAKDLSVLKTRKAETILTPHPGEAARLLGCSVSDVEANRLEACVQLAGDYGCVIVLKGSQTIVTDPGGLRYINTSGNSGMAKGGSGDVLTGLIGGFLAQGMSARDAACAGVFGHGVAGDQAARMHHVRAKTPSDMIDHFGKMFDLLDGR